jgi:hypothetical protein
MSAEVPIFGKIGKHTHRTNKRKEIAPTLNYLSQAELPRGAIAKVHHDTGIPYSMLRNWHDMQNRPGQAIWFPLCDWHPAARAFSHDPEAPLIDCFKTNSIEPGIGGAR